MKQLVETIREMFLQSIANSPSLKKNLSFSEHLDFFNAIKKMSDEKIVRLCEHLILTEARRRGKKPRLSKIVAIILKIGIAAAAGGAWVLTLPIPGTDFLIAAAVYYLYQTKNYECEIACLIGEERDPSRDKEICYSNCDMKSWFKIKQDLQIERAQCQGTPRPDRCFKIIDKQIARCDREVAAARLRIKFRKEDLLKKGRR